MSTTVKIMNKGLFATSVTYNGNFGAKTVILKGGDTLTVANTASAVNPDVPENILNLPPDGSGYTVVKSDFKYDKEMVSIKITEV